MTRALLAFGLVVLLALPVRAEEPIVEVEILAIPERAYVHQEVDIRLRVSLDRDAFRDHAVPLFRRAMDLALDVRAEALKGLPESTGAQGPSFVLNGSLVRADGVTEEVRGGKAWTVLEVRRRRRVETPGVVPLPAPEVHAALARAFQEDFLGSRVAIDRRKVVIRGASSSFEVLPFPDEGRPEAFVDAVGHFALGAALHPGPEGTPFRLVLTLTGDGNLDTLTPPVPSFPPAVHVQGMLDDVGDGVRTLTYDLMEPLSGSEVVVPPVELATFDPTPPAAWRIVRTEALRLGGEAPVATPAPSIGPLLGVLLSLGLALGGWVVLARHRAKAVGPTLSEASTAATRLTDASDLAAGFAGVLAAFLDVPEPAVIGEDLAARLVRAGVGPAEAARASALLKALVAARYGGEPVPDAVAQVRDVLEVVLRGGGESSALASPAP